jgi:hypothetical protein
MEKPTNQPTNGERRKYTLSFKDPNPGSNSYKKGKRVALKGKHLLSRDEILQVVINIEKEVKQKKEKKGKKRKIEVVISSDSGEEESFDELA